MFRVIIGAGISFFVVFFPSPSIYFLLFVLQFHTLYASFDILSPYVYIISGVMHTPDFNRIS